MKKIKFVKTPVTCGGLRKYDHLSAIDAIAKSWNESGSNPEWHEDMQDIVRKAMPLLARSLDRLSNTDSALTLYLEDVVFY